MVCLEIHFPYWQILTSFVVRSSSKENIHLGDGAVNLLVDFSSMFAHKHGGDFACDLHGECRARSLAHMRNELAPSGHLISHQHERKYQILLRGYGTPPGASHETWPWANNGRQCRTTGPQLSGLLMAMSVLGFGCGGALRFWSKSPSHLHLPRVGSDHRTVLVSAGGILSLITSMATQSFLTPLGFGLGSPLFRLFFRIFFPSWAVWSYAQLGSVPRLCTRGQLHSYTRVNSLQ